MAAQAKGEKKTKRRNIPINQDQVLAFAKQGHTNKEIAAALGISDDTLVRRCADVLSVGRNHLTASLRSKQVEVAQSGNVPMLIWLGKNMLGQSDKTDFTSGGDKVVMALHGVSVEEI